MADVTIWYLAIEIYRSSVIVPTPYPSLERCTEAGRAAVYDMAWDKQRTAVVGARDFICVPHPGRSTKDNANG